MAELPGSEGRATGSEGKGPRLMVRGAWGGLHGFLHQAVKVPVTPLVIKLCL